jgi:uncharacterized damage-inducible protein DinB
MEPGEIQSLVRYHAWANGRLMRRAANLAPEQLRAPCGLSHQTLLGTLVHLLDVQWSWRHACETGRLPTAYITADQFSDIRGLRKAWRADDEALLGYAAQLSAEQLTQPVTYSWPQARPRSRPLWHILLHIVNHGTQHRAETGLYLASIGRSPGDMDLLAFLASQPQ